MFSHSLIEQMLTEPDPNLWFYWPEYEEDSDTDEEDKETSKDT